MNINKLINHIITPSTDYKDFQSYRRTILINAVSYATAFVFFFFTIVNVVSGVFLIAGLDLIAGLMSAYAIYDLKHHKILRRASNIATLNLFIFFVLFVYTNQSDNFGLVWTLFFPLFTILMHGHKRGIIYVGLFYAVIFPIAYNGIDVWQAGPWTTQSFLRLFFASILLSYIIYFYELAQEKSETALEAVRENEKIILEQLRVSSHTDTLTGLYNRRYFNNIIPKLLGMSHRNNVYFTFFVLDVDFFKEYNDFYGHQAGDVALQQIAKTLQTSIQRNDDFVFRLGGEEFGGVLLSNDATRIPDIMQKVLENILALNIPHEKSDTHHNLSVSIGYTTEVIDKTSTIEAIYKKADTALYKAKASGRNQAIAAS
ncbi:MAG TPA: GGDEF domain-containing protein [Arcobacter sp.]|nr:GGDEF domain-containing protein [Arcobacter sp.]